MHVYGSTHLGEHERFKDTIYLYRYQSGFSREHCVVYSPPTALEGRSTTGDRSSFEPGSSLLSGLR
jgi:hypothetical protein